MQQTQSIRQMTAMAWQACKEPRSISAAVRHGRFGSACAAAMVALALTASICAIVLALGTDHAAAAGSLITVDEQSLNYAVLVPVVVVAVGLTCFAFNGLTPGYVRRRRDRR